MSKAGIMVHETAHVALLALFDIYGEKNSKALRTTWKAIWNAENYRLLAEKAWTP